MKNRKIFDGWKTTRFDCLLNLSYAGLKFETLEFIIRGDINIENGFGEISKFRAIYRGRYVNELNFSVFDEKVFNKPGNIVSG